MQETLVQFLGGEVPLDKLPIPVFLGFPGGSDGKESTCNVGDLGLIPGLGRFPGKGKATHSSILAYTVHGVTKSQTRLSNFRSLVAQMVKHLPAMQETWVRTLG